MSKVCILGATGMSGRRLLRQALHGGHVVTALVRDSARFDAPENERLLVRHVDFGRQAELSRAMAGHDVVINAAGYLDAADFNPLVQRIIGAAEEALGAGGRFWMFAGAALLDIPGTTRMTVTLPGVPKIYTRHRANYQVVTRTQLDWSVLCPGPMIEAPDGQASEGLVLSREVWPTPRPTITRVLPSLALSVAFRLAVPRLTIFYEDAASVILDHLEANGPLSRSRVGIALAPGERRHKSAPTRADRS